MTDRMMDTKSGYPFWVIANGLIPKYPRLESRERCDVLVIGGGITAALVADDLSRHSHHVIVVDRRDIGWGSTAASTALLQYESDVHMTQLAARYDEATAAKAYLAGVDAVDGLIDLGRDLGDVGMQRTDSVYLASRATDVGDLGSEHSLRRRHGLPCRLVDQQWLAERLRLAAPAALHTRCAAVVDPYRFTCAVLARCARRGTRIYDRTHVTTLRSTARCVIATTEEGVTIRAAHVVLACGFETLGWLQERGLAKLRSTYALVSDPIDRATLGAVSRTMLWETARPYHYVRPTADGRLLVGGEDDASDRPHVRDRRVHSRERALVRYMRGLLPDVSFVPAYAWAGRFAETRDGLPYFGARGRRGPRVLYAMAYGGNGITYSFLGAGLLRAIIERTAHPLADLFGFARRDR